MQCLSQDDQHWLGILSYFREYCASFAWETKNTECALLRTIYLCEPYTFPLYTHTTFELLFFMRFMKSLYKGTVPHGCGLSQCLLQNQPDQSGVRGTSRPMTCNRGWFVAIRRDYKIWSQCLWTSCDALLLTFHHGRCTIYDPTSCW